MPGADPRSDGHGVVVGDRGMRDRRDGPVREQDREAGHVGVTLLELADVDRDHLEPETGDDRRLARQFAAIRTLFSPRSTTFAPRASGTGGGR